VWLGLPKRKTNMFARSVLSAFITVIVTAVSFARDGDASWKIGTPIVTYWAGPPLPENVMAHTLVVLG